MSRGSKVINSTDRNTDRQTVIQTDITKNITYPHIIDIDISHHNFGYIYLTVYQKYFIQTLVTQYEFHLNLQETPQ